MGVCMRDSVCPGCSSMRPLFLLSYPPFFFQSESGPYNYRECARDQLVLIEAGRVAIAPELKTQPFPYVAVSLSFRRWHSAKLANSTRTNQIS